MRELKRIAVYCGSNYGEDKDFYYGAKAVGKLLATSNIELVYGGSVVGLMGTVANECLNHDGKVIGVIPSFLKELELQHKDLTEIYVTPDMSTRKDKMIELSDGFIVMPGGVGTLEELFDTMSASQLKQAVKPIGLLNINGFYDKVLEMLEVIAEQGFMPKANLCLIVHSSDPEQLIELMKYWEPVEAHKWNKPSWYKKEFPTDDVK